MKFAKYVLVPPLIAVFVLFTTTFIVYQLTTLYPQAPDLETDTLQPSVGYWEWMFGGTVTSGVVNGDFGTSLTTRQPIVDLLAERLPASTELFWWALLQSLLLGVPLGIMLAVFRRWLTDGFLRPFAWLGASLPVFWVALMLILIYAVQLREFPIGGRCSPAGDCPPVDQRMEYLALPLTSLLIAWTPVVTLHVRHHVLIAAEKWGAQRWGRTIVDGIIRPLLASLPSLMAGMISSLVLVETIFSWPGVGRLLLDSIMRRDLPVIVPVVVIPTIWMVVAFLVTTILAGLLSGVLERSTPQPEAPEANTNQHVPPSVSENTFTGSTDNHSSNRRIIDQLYTFAAVAAGVVLIVILTVIFVPSVLTSADPLENNLTERLLPPGSETHPLGTDELGRDYLAQLLYAGRGSFWIAVQAALIALLIGGLVGFVGGLFMDSIGVILNIPIDIVVVSITLIPILPLLLMARSVFGMESSSLPLLMALVGWVTIVPPIRAQVAAFFNPNLKAPSALSWLFLLIYALTINLILFIPLEAGLSFLGVGVQPPEGSLGAILARGRNMMAQANYLIFWPGVLLTLIVFCLYVIGSRLRDAYQFK